MVTTYGLMGPSIRQDPRLYPEAYRGAVQKAASTGFLFGAPTEAERSDKLKKSCRTLQLV